MTSFLKVEVDRCLISAMSETANSEPKRTVATLPLEIERNELEVRIALAEELKSFNADKLQYFETLKTELPANKGHRHKLDTPLRSDLFTGVNAAIGMSRISGVAAIARFSFPDEAIELACRILHSLLSELDESPLTQGMNNPLCTHRIRSLLNATAKLATPDVNRLELREWSVLVGEFISDAQRFDEWIETNHPDRFRRFAKVLEQVRQKWRSMFVITQLPESKNGDDLAVPWKPDGQTSPPEMSLTAVATIEGVSASTTILQDDPVRVLWKGPLIDAKGVSKKLFAVGREIDAQTLKNSYWNEWKPHDHQKGKAFLFYWDRIMPIVERQFDVKLEDQ